MKIGELANRSGLSIHTLRYYETLGLLPVGRSGDPHDHDAAMLDWIAFVERLKAGGMPLREIARYAALREVGDATRAERRRLLEAHRERVRAQIAELESHLAMLDQRIAGHMAADRALAAADADGGGR